MRRGRTRRQFSAFFANPNSPTQDELQRVVAQRQKGHPNLGRHLHNVGLTFMDRYFMTGDLSNLEAALQISQAAVSLMPQGHSDLPECLSGLSLALSNRYRRLGNLEDLEAALQNDQLAVNLTPIGDLNLPERLTSLASTFGQRYERLGELDDLEAALKNDQMAVNLTPRADPQFPNHLQSLAVSLEERFIRLGDLTDLEAALKHAQTAVELTPKNHSELGLRLQSLAGIFAERYKRLGDIKDLDAALEHDQAAVGLTADDDPELPGRLQALAVSFGERFERLGDLNDLEATLQHDRKAVSLTPTDHAEFPLRLQGLAMSLHSRYHRLGDLDDLNAALESIQASIHLTPKDHSQLPGRLQAVAMFFRHRYNRQRDLRDIEDSLTNLEAAISLVAINHTDLPQLLEEFSLSYLERYHISGDLQDLHTALENDQKAVQLTPKDHPDYARRLQSLAATYIEQYRKLRDLQDLESGLQNSKAAVGSTPEGHPELPRRLQNLAACFQDRYDRLQDSDDLAAVFTNYNLSFKNPIVSKPVSSWEAALAWASLAKTYKPAEVLTAYLNAFKLLPEILWIGNPVNVHHDAMRRINFMQATSDAVAACIDHANLHLAVEILEQGLATTFQRLIQLKPNIKTLVQAEADKLQHISTQLYLGNSPNPKGLAIERTQLLAKIRSHPGFENFLLPKYYKDLCHAAKNGPVIILNSHKDHCHVIVLLNTDTPFGISLPGVTLEGLKHQRAILKDVLRQCHVRMKRSDSSRLHGTQESLVSKPAQDAFEDMLTWVWDNIVGHIYTALELHEVVSGHLWWCPTGLFTGLPLHAAAPSDQFVQSYTATLEALLKANARTLPVSAPTIGVVGVTHSGSGGESALPGVKKEIAKIVSVVGKDHVHSVVGHQATVEAVKHELQQCSWVHLACHGKQDLYDPSKSYLQLYEGTLTLETILKMPLSNAEFVFLAACQTAMGDAELMNESFHLGGGFIAAGFQGMIGTMWSMCDTDGPVIAEEVYAHIFSSGKRAQPRDAAKALQLAVRKLRDNGATYERWVPFIHMGV
ncbi:CHAT domain-containing protein [Mycena pura]|uniref:CHAT domain-containing protein n=1 Tax=Mycena pura TaxID=153505 RepID=A0AAD6YDN5_9AGAR|nr:CHAT domain-containing protein [Mycena pura]